MKKVFAFTVIILTNYFLLTTGTSAQNTQEIKFPTEEIKFSKEEFEITVPCLVSLETRVKLGHYNYRDSSICGEIYPGCESVHISERVKITLIKFNQFVGTDEVYQIMLDSGYRPAKFQELLALGAEMPDLQKQYDIVAFGSFWKDQDKGYAFGLKLCSAYAFKARERTQLRGLKEVNLDKKWEPYCLRFAAVYEGDSYKKNLALD